MVADARTLGADLRRLGLRPGDGVFVHASARALGPVEGGAAAVIEALLSAVGPRGLLGMPAFCADAYFPPAIDRAALTPEEIARIEAAVPGFDPARSPCPGMGAVAEAFRAWPGVHRSAHPAVSVCLLGPEAEALTAEHALAFALGDRTPMGALRERPAMKVLLIGVGWNRCSALHVAETFAEPRRLKTRRFKTGPGAAPWIETPDVADDLGRLFPACGAAFEASGAVTRGLAGEAVCRLCAYAELVDFAARWIGEANARSGARA